MTMHAAMTRGPSPNYWEPMTDADGELERPPNKARVGGGTITSWV